ncbi:sugar lactone lactonase YvrE [Agromyces flavus]|uniref:Sugar lactone lactonase YvrE n=1 Tax=Agromyces flavus TaxID=589382 RepID=A0A1H1VDT1_9MICO|nr:SMP-30/gluconolactonase/LRE family protein [Agromyces flavus]MCP2365907.1 sugar lactone lactonase YvrE [Agromyces flavus]GGI43619.1 gluconolactonase [Agromyces flavus]SDS82825.1 Sugar lactone lactonase YvrE [Agromyces flavus]
MRAERITGRVAYHGEGAFWDDRDDRLRFVDMLAGAVVTLLPTGTVSRRQVGEVAAVIRHRSGGGYVVAGARDILLLDADWGPERSIPVLDDPAMRLNEGGCDAAGRFYIGSMAYDMTAGAGTLYRLDPNGRLGTALTTVTIPNGLVWSADGARAFHNDTAAATITAYDADPDGRLLDPRVLVRFEPGGAAPDGMAIDADGGLWVALWGGARVHRYSPDGILDEVVDVPGAHHVTSCAFGGDDRRTLFITTSVEGIEPAARGAGGSLFAVDLAVAGAPVHAYAG